MKKIVFGSHLAQEIINTVIAAAQKVPHSSLKKVLWYDSITDRLVEDGMGREICLVLEVNQATFENYIDRCENLEGVRPLSDDLLHSDYNPAFDYFSAAGFRSDEALAVIGVDYTKLYLTPAQHKALDIVCLPEGWDDAKSEMHRRLLDSLAECDDPNFLERVIKTGVQLFPR